MGQNLFQIAPNDTTDVPFVEHLDDIEQTELVPLTVVDEVEHLDAKLVHDRSAHRLLFLAQQTNAGDAAFFERNLHRHAAHALRLQVCRQQQQAHLQAKVLNPL